MNEKITKLRELLEEQHSFPGSYTFKFIGKSEDHFAARVVAAVRAALASTQDPPYATRASGQGGHISVTLTPVVASADQVLAVYEGVGSVEGLLVSL